MEPAKNVQVYLPQMLVAQMEKTAEDGRITLDELVRQALQRYMADRSWAELYAYGEGQARRLGVEEDDVERIVHEFRQEETGHQNQEPGR